MANKKDITNGVAELTGWTKKKSKESIEAIVGCIKESLAGGEDVKLVGFGTFKIKERAERMGRNPQTGDPLLIPAKKVVKFKAGKDLAESVLE